MRTYKKEQVWCTKALVIRRVREMVQSQEFIVSFISVRGYF